MFHFNRFTILATLLVSSTFCMSQNLQLHYDMGRLTNPDAESSRPQATATVEMFRPDRWGSTFLFVDMDFLSDGMAGAYWEVARELNLAAVNPHSSLAAHVEYNGGLASDKLSYYGARFQHAALVGPAWNWHSTDFTKTFSLQLMYKQYFRGSGRHAFPSFQATAVWSCTFSHGLLTASGFADLWRDPDVDGQLIFLTEPQLWLNLNAISGIQLPLSIGTEWELSNNFIHASTSRTFFWNPTVAMKWTF